MRLIAFWGLSWSPPTLGNIDTQIHLYIYILMYIFLNPKPETLREIRSRDGREKAGIYGHIKGHVGLYRYT